MVRVEVNIEGTKVRPVFECKDLEAARKMAADFFANGIAIDDDGEGPIIETAYPGWRINSISIIAVAKD